MERKMLSIPKGAVSRAALFSATLFSVLRDFYFTSESETNETTEICVSDTQKLSSFNLPQGSKSVDVPLLIQLGEEKPDFPLCSLN